MFGVWYLFLRESSSLTSPIECASRPPINIYRFSLQTPEAGPNSVNGLGKIVVIDICTSE